MNRFERARDSVWLMIIVALGIRLAATGFLYPEQLTPSGDHISFGYEAGRMARSLALGRGFSDPLFAPSGPTAWLAPVYPLLLAGIFKAFGIYTKASALAILSLDSLFSALTCLPVYLLARRSFGARVGAWAGWAWGLFPYSVYLAAERVWDHVLTALLFTILVAWSARLAEPRPVRESVGYGCLWGVAALTNPAVLASLPFLGAWMIWRLCRRGMPWLWVNAAAALAFVAILTPWMARNHLVFHKFVPIRDVFWVEFRADNSPYDWERWNYMLHPAGNQTEFEQMRAMGENAYAAAKKQQALEYVAEHPGRFARLTARRILNEWTGAWNLNPGYLVAEDFEVANIVLYTMMTVLMLFGIRRAWQTAREALVPYLLVLLSFPLVYYVTSPNMRHRHPLDPEILILAVYGVIGWADQARGRFGTAADAGR